MDSNLDHLITEITKTTTTLQPPPPPVLKGRGCRRNGGRPFGSKSKPYNGMPLNKRLKTLQKIALDDTQKSSDRIAAISLMTQLLNDKVQATKEGEVSSVLKFEAIMPLTMEITDNNSCNNKNLTNNNHLPINSNIEEKDNKISSVLKAVDNNVAAEVVTEDLKNMTVGFVKNSSLQAKGDLDDF